MKIKNITLLNSISSFLLQIVTIISGFVIPRLILSTFGSEVNGLVSSLNQFLGYITILEGGVSSVIMANLYKPLHEQDEEKISSIIKTTQKFFKKLGIIFVIYTFILAIAYPLIFNKSFDFMYIFGLTLILSMTSFIQYMFSLSYKLLLNADRKVHIVSFAQILTILLNVTIFAILINFFPNIHILKFITAIIFILQPIIYNIYVKKYFKITKDVKEDNSLLKSRWDGFGINIAAFMHFNTDIAILTIFTDLKIVSIYSVYALVTTGLRQLIIAITNGISPTIGKLYASGNTEELKNKFDKFEFIMTFITVFCFTIAGLLITPFVQIYTSNITDTNYFQPIFGILLVLSEAVYCLKEPFVSLAYSANKFKDIKLHAYIEAALNIIVSIILVSNFGLIGVAIGTLVAMTYRTLFHIIYLKFKIINRPVMKFFKKLLIYGIAIAIVILLSIFVIPIGEITIVNWIIKGIIYSVVLLVLMIILSLLFYKSDIKYFMNMFFKKKAKME